MSLGDYVGTTSAPVSQSVRPVKRFEVDIGPRSEVPEEIRDRTAV